MLTGHLVVENFDYALGEADFPLFENGEPLLDEEGEQTTAHFHLLAFTPAEGTTIEVRVRDEAWDTFVANLTKTKVKTATMAEVEQLAKVLP